MNRIARKSFFGQDGCMENSKRLNEQDTRHEVDAMTGDGMFRDRNLPTVQHSPLRQGASK